MTTLNYIKALADETRLRIFRLLGSHELSASEIVDTLAMGQSRVSRHLKILTDSGLVTVRRDGLWAHFTLSTDARQSGFLKGLLPVLGSERFYDADLTRVMRLKTKRSEETKRFFDTIAEDWDAMRREIIGDADLDGAIMAKVSRCGVAVDLGCGIGDLLPLLASKSKLTIGVDSSTRMLRSAGKLAGSSEKIELRIGSLEHLPLREGEADCAIVNMVLHHLERPELGIREAARILTPVGRFILSDLLKHDLETMQTRFGDRWLGFDIDELKSMLTENGFTVSSIKEIPLNLGLSAVVIRAEKIKAKKRRIL